jgi:hypothetical protein
MNNERQLYKIKLIEIASTLKGSNIESRAAIMHALCEVAAEVAFESGFEFEDYSSCASCAWSCAMERVSNRDVN